ncbi:MAG: hypothetical protein LCH32_02065 [Bacteroidetes bacterium]|nr:hypothetical protein [Bacteroidota bacterium]
MAAETQYTANTGVVTLSTANSNLDGTGTLGLLLTASAYGTLIKTITVKAQQTTTTQGMVRIFIYNGSSYYIVQEIEIPANTNAATTQTFEFTWNCDIKLKADWKLYASTQNSESFNVIAQGLNWTYYTSSVRPESTRFTANTGVNLLSTANSNLNGTGTLVEGLTASASSNGTRIETLTIKALSNTTSGMIRVFIDDTHNKYLFKEFDVEGVDRSGSQASFVIKNNLINFELQAGYKLQFATQNAENFALVVEANDWTYPA